MDENPYNLGPHTRALYPETGAGGYSRADGTVQFYLRVNALAHPAMTVLDLGAGRGEFLEDPIPWRRDLRNLKGKVAKLVGADVDPVVMTNPALDEAAVITPGKALPFADASFDMIVSDYTLEHIDDRKQFAAECARVLRPGGWLCARTPNKWGYIGVGARVVPNKAHSAC
jgi:ubiquinone/menaquinone biosynthesis C-methylase UbiE